MYTCASTTMHAPQTWNWFNYPCNDVICRLAPMRESIYSATLGTTTYVRKDAQNRHTEVKRPPKLSGAQHILHHATQHGGAATRYSLRRRPFHLGCSHR